MKNVKVSGYWTLSDTTLCGMEYVAEVAITFQDINCTSLEQTIYLN